MASLLKRFRSLRRRTKIISIVIIVVLIFVGFSLRPKTPTYQYVDVTSGPITETVSVTGNTTPISSVTLGFGNSGTIASISSAIGKYVNAGQVLATLNTSDLQAQVAQAQANVDTQKSKLQGLQAGAQPEDIAASQASLDKANQDLANMYDSIADTSADGYAKANDAVRVQLNLFFSNAETTNPSLTYATTNSQTQTEAEIQRQAAAHALDTWQAQLAANATSDSDLDTSLLNDVTYLTAVRQLLNDVSVTLQSAPGLSATTLASYKASVTTGLSEVNLALTNLNTIEHNISSQKLTVSQLQAELDLKKAGATSQDIQAQQAQVESAQAAVESIQAKLENSQIVAPISGVITQFDAKVGQFATLGTTLVSIISNNSFEVDALVSETDIGKVALHNTVTMTLDAFPGETFTGSVFYIDPAQTTDNGVVGYKIKVSFDKPDSRLKSGLTANMDIQTRHKDNVLLLPEYAILQNDQGTYVETVQNGAVKNVPVTLGLQDASGNVEIENGVTAGEKVLNIGLKQK
jgi:HlyD family secretion protein